MVAAKTDEECEEDPKCEVVVVRGIRTTQGLFLGVLRSGDYGAPDPPDPHSGFELEEDEARWDCGPLMLGFDRILRECNQNANAAHVRCKHDQANRGVIGFALDEFLGLCDSRLATAKDQCVADDKRRRALLPPEECDNDN